MPAAGLCGTCVHTRTLSNDRGSEFLLCERGLTDPKYMKYPRLPVLQCAGHQPGSAKPLIDKLGIKPGMRVEMIGLTDATLLAGADRTEGPCDVILLGVENVAGLDAIAACRTRLKPAGGVWVVYPKGRKDITQTQVMEAGLTAGLVDNKVVSFSTTHTGLRFVIRRADR